MNSSIDNLALVNLKRHLSMTAEEIVAMQNPDDDGLYDMLLDMSTAVEVQEFYVRASIPSLQCYAASPYRITGSQYIIDINRYTECLANGEDLCAA